MVYPTTSPELSSIEALAALLRARRVVVLGGAGCSTESGIPDYRGPEGSLRARRPIQYQEFLRSEATRARYWARSAVGWPRMAGARPNAAHAALARLEEAGLVRGLITQNVDGLHQAAGSARVLELHGSLARVRCLACAALVDRDDFQGWLRVANPEWSARVLAPSGGVDGEVAPDGDAEVEPGALDRFRVPPCPVCGGMLKPDVVFFGENVPRERLSEAWHLFDQGDVLLVVGSSLTVYSGRRFVLKAQERAVPVGIVNLGPTRGDDVAAAKVDGRLGLVLPRLTEALLGE